MVRRLDGEVGGADAGFAYGVTAYLLGGGVRWGRGNALCLTGGAGPGPWATPSFAGRFPSSSA